MADPLIWRSTLIIVWFSAQPFSGSVGEAAPPPFCVLPRLARLASDHYYLFLQGVSQHLGYLIFLDYQPCLIWTFTRGIRSNLGGLFLFGCFQRFRRSFRSGQQIFLNASLQSGVSVPPDLFGDIFSCRQVFNWTTARLAVLIYGGSHSFQSSPWFLGGLQRSQRDCFAFVSMSLEVLTQLSLLVVYWRRRSQWAAYLISDVISSVSVFPHFMLGGEDNNRDNRIIG